MPKITIVDENDRVIGAMDRAEATAKEQIVRIVRVLLFNSRDELFLQKRTQHVTYPGLWDQSAGGHVDEGEDYLTAAKREANEEIGLSGVELKQIAYYYSEFEYEGRKRKRFNTLYTTVSDMPLTLNPDEVADGKWISSTELNKWIEAEPEKFTNGFIHAYKLYRNGLKK